MPTSRPRYLLTESDRLREALEIAQRQWPEDAGRPTALLLRLIDAGRREIDSVHSAQRADRLAAIDRLGQGLEGSYSVGYLADLREEWPE